MKRRTVPRFIPRFIMEGEMSMKDGRQKWGRGFRRVLPGFLCVCMFVMQGGLETAWADWDYDQGEGGRPASVEYSLNDFYFDTVISIRFYAGENGNELTDGCRSICDEIQETFSRTDEDSELYAVNHRAPEQDLVEVSAPLAELVTKGLEYYELSDGRFDITIAPLSELWDFRSGEAVIPSEAEIQSALRKVDASAVHVERITAGTDETGTDTTETIAAGTNQTGMNHDGTVQETEPDAGTWGIRFDSPETMIDLGALVKGYAADCLAEYLKGEGVTSGLINLGGNVLAIGPKPDGNAWKIGIQKPFDTGIVDTVEVMGQSVVSSGVYERCFEQDGKLYHHILDPKTGYPVENGLWGVSIISDSSLTGDALSTTCLLIGQDEASELIRSTEGVRAIFVDDSLHVTECE